jgi:hypothetical protein
VRPLYTDVTHFIAFRSWVRAGIGSFPAGPLYTGFQTITKLLVIAIGITTALFVKALITVFNTFKVSRTGAAGVCTAVILFIAAFLAVAELTVIHTGNYPRFAGTIQAGLRTIAKLSIITIHISAA